MTSRGAVPGSAVVKQEENISREVSQGPRKREEQHTGPLFPSMQHRSEKEGVPPPTPRQPVLSDESQSRMFCAMIPTRRATAE